MSTQSHILVADDERSIRLMLETGLTLNGFRVTAVRNGREALEAMSAGKFDAVLSDIYMPDLGGLEVDFPGQRSEQRGDRRVLADRLCDHVQRPRFG